MHAASLPQDALRQRADYDERIGSRHMTPLWEVLGALMPPQPRSPASPHLWHYADLREQVMEAGRLITAEEAERTTMRRGDFIITPAWTWHDHGNLGEQPVVWLDGLDIPIVRFLDAGFAERSEQQSQQTLRPEGDALARYGANMLPLDYHPAPAEPTRVFVYPFERTRASLTAISQGTPDPRHGFKLRYVNPATGASPMPTIGAFAQRLPAGFETQPLRSTDGTVQVCLEGDGEVRVGERSWRFQENDVFVVPSWHALQLRADRDALMFSFSDRPVQQALGLWREARL